MADLQRIGIVGAGAWGTALAQTSRAAGRDVLVWGRDPTAVAAINATHRNDARLPAIELDPAIHATTELSLVAECDALLLVVPAQSTRTTARALAPLLSRPIPLVLCAKGLEQGTGRLLTDVVGEEIPGAPLAVLSGPGFASEIARGLPTALTLAAGDAALARRLAGALATRALRLYDSTDLIGVSLGGAMKNVLAIAAGIVLGRGLGASAHAALVTRGFAELTRLGRAMGARSETLTGLSGLGDVILSCGSPLSRNLRLGLAIGKAGDARTILDAPGALAEGAFTASAAIEAAQTHSVEVPVSAAVQAILTGAMSVDETIDALLSRPLRAEG